MSFAVPGRNLVDSHQDPADGSLPTAQLNAHAHALIASGYSLPAHVSVTETAQQMTADIARFGADKLLTEQQLAYFRSQDGQITLRMWEMNQQQNNYLQMQSILGNTQLANALAVRTELSAACASNAERIELARTMGTMLTRSCPQFASQVRQREEAWCKVWTTEGQPAKKKAKATPEQFPINITNLKKVAKTAIEEWTAGGQTTEGKSTARARFQTIVHETWGGYANTADLIRFINRFLGAFVGPGKLLKQNATWQQAVDRFINQLMVHEAKKPSTNTPRTKGRGAAAPKKGKGGQHKRSTGGRGKGARHDGQGAAQRTTVSSTTRKKVRDELVQALFLAHVDTDAVEDRIASECAIGRTEKNMALAMWLKHNQIKIYTKERNDSKKCHECFVEKVLVLMPFNHWRNVVAGRDANLGELNVKDAVPWCRERDFKVRLAYAHSPYMLDCELDEFFQQLQQFHKDGKARYACAACGHRSRYFLKKCSLSDDHKRMVSMECIDNIIQERTTEE